MHNIRPFLPELFTDPGSMLYIGARPDAHSWLDEFIDAGNTVTVLDIWPENVKGLKQDSRFKIVLGDARKPPFASNSFDYVIWWHGPEHVWPSELEKTFDALKKIARKTLAVATPYGIYEQGPSNDNPYEEHVAAIYPSTLEWLGIETATDGEANVPGGEVVGWIRK